MALKVGDIVRVYEAPFSAEKLEDEAVLVRLISDLEHEGFERWQVRFPDGTFERIVHERHRVS